MSAARRHVALLVALALVAVMFALLRGGARRTVELASERQSDRSSALAHASPLTQGPVPSDSAPNGSTDSRVPEAERPSAGAEQPRPQLEDDPVLCIVYGRVVGSDGQPIPQWKPYLGLTNSQGQRVGADCREDGNYSLSGVAPGTYQFSCGAVGFHDVRASLGLTLTEPIVRRDVTLERAVVLEIDVLTPDGRPFRVAEREKGVFHGLLPVATREAPGATIPDADGLHNDHVGFGNYWDYGPPCEALGPAGIGVVMLDGDLPAYVSLLSGIRVLATQRVEPGASKVSFVLPLDALEHAQASVRLRALDAETRAPLQGLASLTGRTGEQVKGRLEADGSWHGNAQPGLYDLRIEADGYERLPRRVRLEAGAELDLGDLALAHELTLEARVVDADGQPVNASFLLGWNDPELGTIRFQQLARYATKDGVLRIPGLRADNYVLRTSGEDDYRAKSEAPSTGWVSGHVAFSTLGGAVRGLEVRLVRPCVLVLRGAAALAEGSSFRLLDEHGIALRSSPFYAGFVPRLAVPPGSYTLEVFGPDESELLRRAVSVGPGTSEVDVAH